jgi:predicted transcriptional regulator
MKKSILEILKFWKAEDKNIYEDMRVAKITDNGDIIIPTSKIYASEEGKRKLESLVKFELYLKEEMSKRHKVEITDKQLATQ